MADEQQVPQGVWEFDINQWSLDDLVQFEKASSLEDKLPIMLKAIIRTPVLPADFDPSDTAARKKITAFQWAELQRRFTSAVTNFFR